MVKLTDQLGQTNYTPQTTGGGAMPSALGGFAEVGADVLDMFSNRNRSAASSAGAKNNVALDELAMGEFQILTGIDLNKPGGKELQEAERFQAAKNNGAMSQTAYDVRMQNWYADVMRNHPDQAHEILSEGYSRKMDHFIFREAYEQQNIAANQFEQEKNAVNSLLKLATDSGWYTPGNMSQEQGIANGAKLARLQQQQAEEDRTIELMSKQHVVDKDLWERQLSSLQSNRVNRQLEIVSTTVGVGMHQLYNLYDAAGENSGRHDQLNAVYDNMEMGLMQLESTMTQHMYANPTALNYTDTAGQKKTDMIPYTEQDITRVRNEIKVQKETLTKLRGMKSEEAKRFLENFGQKSKVEATQRFQGLMGMSQGLGLTVPQAMEMIALSDTNGIPTATKVALMDEFSKGMGQIGDNTAAFVASQIKQGLTPAINGETAEIRLKAFSQSLTSANALGEMMVQGKLPPGSNLKGFEDYASQVIVTVNKAYTPANINLSNAKQATDSIFNTKFLSYIEAYEKNGGDAEAAKMMGVQAGIGAAKFVEALGSDPLVTYVPELGQYMANPKAIGGADRNQMIRENRSPAGPGNFSDTSAARDKARTLNNLLYFIDKTNDKYPMVEGGASVRDVVAGDGLAKWAQTQMAKPQGPNTQQLFDQAIDEFSMDTNPYDNAPDTGDAISNVLVREGGFVEDDNGAGPTNFGINSKANPDVDVENLTEDEAREIYESRYMAPVIEAGVPAEAREAVFDSAVNQGVKAALDLWKAAKGDVERFTELRIAKYLNTPVKKPKDMEADQFPAYEDRIRAAWVKRAKESAGM